MLSADSTNYHTPAITALRKTFSKQNVFSGYGWGYPQYAAIAVNATPKLVAATIKNCSAQWTKRVVEIKVLR